MRSSESACDGSAHYLPTFFVAANGNDNGPGTQAQPWASIDRVNGAVLTPGTQVFFRGGDTFVGNLRPVINGGDPNNPVIIGSYGNGRAEFNPAVGGFGQGVVNLDNNGLTGITIQDLILRCPNNAIQPRGTIRIANNSALPSRGITIQRCDVTAPKFNRFISADFGGGIKKELTPGSGGIDSVLIKNNDIHGVLSEGPASQVDGGITGQTLTDETHIGNIVWFLGTAGTQSQNFNPTFGVGIVYPPMGDGLDFNGTTNGLSKYNISHNNGWNFNGGNAGPCGYLATHSDQLIWRFNEAYRITPDDARASDGSFVAVDFAGFDPDVAAGNSLIECCLAYDCYNSGFETFQPSGPITFRKNVSFNNCTIGLFGFLEYQMQGSAEHHIDSNFAFNNRAYHGIQFQNPYQGAGFLGILNNIAAGSIKNNVAYIGTNVFGNTAMVSAQSVSTHLDVGGNQWFGTSPGSWAINGGRQSDVASFDAAAGGSGDSYTQIASLGTTEFGFLTLLPATNLGLSAGELQTCISALQAMQNHPGIESGNSPSGVPLPGARIASLISRFQAGNSPVTLPEYIALGLCLTRMDTPASNALLARVEPIMLAS